MASLPATSMGSNSVAVGASLRRSPPLYGLRLTLTGLLVIFVVVLVGISSFTSEANLLLLLCGIAAGLLAFNLVAAVRTVRRIDVDRVISEAAVAGRSFRVTYTVRNRRRWSRAWAITIGEVPVGGDNYVLGQVFVPVLAPREERQIEMLVSCPNRGRVSLAGIRVFCGFPFGLFTCRCDIQAKADLLVYPAVGRVRREFWHQKTPVESPTARRGERGATHDEFHGVREYREGDNPRWIHWRRSARTGELVVREHQQRRESQLICLVDPWPMGSLAVGPGGRRGKTRVGSVASDVEKEDERLISAAATAICEGLDRGYRVGLVCRAAVPVIIAPASGRAQRRRLLRELTLLTPGSSVALDQLISRVRWSGHRNARCMVFTPQPEDLYARAFRALSSRSESLIVVSPQSGWMDRLFDLTSVMNDKRRLSS